MSDQAILIWPRKETIAYRVNWADLEDSSEYNVQLNSNYEVSFTMTYTKQYANVFNIAEPKAWVSYNGEWYTIQQADTTINKEGFLQKKVTAVDYIIDKMKNVRIDKAQPTEDNPDISGGGSTDTTKPQQSGEVVKKTAEQQTYSLDNRLSLFLKNNDQGLSYELHGKFPQVAVDVEGNSLYEWLNSHLKDFSAYWLPSGNTVKIYDLSSLQHQTGKQFRYLHNTTEAEIQNDNTNLVNDCEVYGGKMEKDITTDGGSSSGGGAGNLDNVEGFCKSPINASFGCNKQAMINDFARRSARLHYTGCDANKLYDVIKQNGVSPEWFFAYELQEGLNTNYGWLNHTYWHGDGYADAAYVCSWIKQTSNSATITPAWWAPEGSMAPNSGLAAKWNSEFGKGTIGRVYLQGTAAATWDLAGVTPNPAIGKPITGCVQVIRSWGGHTVQASDANGGGTWGWPFPSVGEGKFVLGQTFGTHPQDGVGRTNGFHDGLDFGSIDHPGSEVHAVHGGKCIVSRDYVPGVSWYCVIQDSTGLNVEYQEAFGSASNIKINVGQQVNTGDVIGYRTTDHLHIGITRHSFREAFGHAFSNDGTWLDPYKMIKNGIASGGTASSSDDSGSTSLTTTNESYYALHYHYTDDASIKRYGLHRGKPLTMDSIYDMNSLRLYADTNIQHDPPTTLTVKNFYDTDFNIGDIIRVIVPEMNLSQDVTLMGIKIKPFAMDKHDCTLSFNNTGLVMKNIINSLYQDIHNINTNVTNLDTFSAIGGRYEEHFNNITTDQNSGNTIQFTEAQAKEIKEFTDS